MPSPETICARLREHATLRGDATFSSFHARGSVETISFSTLFERALRYAALYAQRGVKRGDVVIVILKHSPHLFYSFLGALLAGAVPSFMPFPSHKQRPEHYWRDHAALFERIKPAVLVTYAENAQAAAEHLPRFAGTLILANDDAVAHIAPADPAIGEACAPEDLACLQHSSGTTQRKKGVMLTHRAVLAAADAYAQTIGLTREDRIASWLPLYHDMGFIACFMTAVTLGTQLIALDPFEWVVRPTMLLDAIERHGAHFCWLPNFAFSHIAGAARAEALWDLSSMRAFINCSEPCKAATFERFLARFAACGVRAESLQVCYAMAENVFAVTQTEIGRPPRALRCDAQAFAQGRIEPERAGNPALAHLSCGKPIPGVRARICNDEGAELAAGEIGEVHIASDFLFSGYYELPEETEKRLHAGSYRTGDLGFLFDGELYVTGRIDDMLVLNGRNYYAHEIEAIVSEVPGSSAGRAVALSIEDRRTDSTVAVVLAETQREIDAQAFRTSVRRAIQERLGLAIHDVVPMEAGALVKTTSGKISRSENRALYLEATA